MMPKEEHPLFRSDEIWQTDVGRAEIWTHTYNCLVFNAYNHLGKSLLHRHQICSMTDRQLIKIPGIGPKTLADIREIFPYEPGSHDHVAGLQVLYPNESF